MIEFLNYIADDYFANKLGNHIIEHLCQYNIDKKYYIDKKYLHICVKHRKYKEEFFREIQIIPISQCFIILRQDYFNDLMKEIDNQVKSYIKFK